MNAPDRVAVMTVGGLQLDVAFRKLSGTGGTVTLSPLATRLLSALAAQPGRTISRTELIDELWNGNYFVGDKALNRVVSETRRAARQAGADPLIETVQKTGYRLYGAIQPPETSVGAARRRRIPSWLAALVVFAVVVVGLMLLIDSLTGLIWLSQHPN